MHNWIYAYYIFLYSQGRLPGPVKDFYKYIRFVSIQYNTIQYNTIQ